MYTEDDMVLKFFGLDRSEAERDIDSWQYANGYVRGMRGTDITPFCAPSVPHLLGYIDAIFDVGREDLFDQTIIGFARQRRILKEDEF